MAIHIFSNTSAKEMFIMHTKITVSARVTPGRGLYRKKLLATYCPVDRKRKVIRSFLLKRCRGIDVPRSNFPSHFK